MKATFHLNSGCRWFCLAFAGLAFAITGQFTPAQAQAPAWWANRLVITNRAASDYSPANQGQAKWMATNAFLEFLDKLPGDGNTNILNLLSTFTTNGNYQPINIGQVKALAKPFYDRIQEVSTSLPYVITARPTGVTGTHPWTASTSDDSDYSPVNIGQLKYIFSFDFDRNNDGTNDMWAPNSDADGDYLSNIAETTIYGTDPADADTDGDGRSDWQETADGTNPLDPASLATWAVTAYQPTSSAYTGGGEGEAALPFGILSWPVNGAWHYKIIGGESAVYYEIYLGYSASGPYVWVGRTFIDVDSILDPSKLGNPPPYAYFVVASNSSIDSDEDGIPDGFEGLITHTDPYAKNLLLERHSPVNN